MGSGETRAAAQTAKITLEEFRIEPMTLRPGEAFVVHARAAATGVKLGSFLVRTAEDVKKEDTIPGFPLYLNGRYYIAEDDQPFLKDNGKLDRDPREGAFAVEISTQGWKEGTYALALFASVRPAQGPFVAARHDFAVVVKGDRVAVEDLGGDNVKRSREITEFNVQPTTVQPGRPVKILLRFRSASAEGAQITDPYSIAAAETLPGFFYDEAKKKSFYGKPPAVVVADNGELDRDPQAESIVLEMDTRGWPPGVHLLVLNATGSFGKVVDYRAFAVKVPDPRDRMEVTVEPATFFGMGTHFTRFIRLRDGTLLAREKFSQDGGRSWQGKTGGFGNGGVELRDGVVLGLDYRCLPIEGKEGWYAADRHVSDDHGRNFQKSRAEFHVPEAKAAQGHAFHRGPLFMGSIVERADGSLVALMAGWFKSDTALCPYGRGRPYSRTYVCESADRGLTWRYLSTIGYAQIGSEGFNEGSMRRLPGGELLAVARTGNPTDIRCQDNPIMWSVSRDEGRTWSEPQRTGLKGVYPNLAVLSDGQVAMSYGRPGALVAFSADAGGTWTDATCVDAEPSSGYTDVTQTGEGEVLVGFGVRGYLDPETGVRADHLRLARLRYRVRGQ